MLSNEIKAMDHQFRIGNRKVSKIVLIIDMVHIVNDKGEMNQKLQAPTKDYKGLENSIFMI